MAKEIWESFTGYIDSMKFLERIVESCLEKFKSAFYVKNLIDEDLMQIEKFNNTTILIKVAYEEFLIHFDVVTPISNSPKTKNVRQIAEITFLEFNRSRLDGQLEANQIGDTVFFGGDHMIRNSAGDYIDAYSNSYELQVFNQLVREILKVRGLLEDES